MTYYADLEPCGYFGIEFGSGLRSIGWLDESKPHQRGPISAEFVSALKSLLMEPWEPCVSAGFHRCPFCRITGGPATFPTDIGEKIILGSNNLFVPGDGFLYVAPSTILHYMDAHGYSPPAEFQTAVLNCPQMRSMQYLKAVLKNAPRGFLQRFRDAGLATNASSESL